MKLPSLTQIGAGYGRTFRRFPLVIIGALVGAIAGIILVEYEGPPGPTILFNVLLASVLGLPLLATFQLAHERAGTGEVKRWVWQLIGLVLLVAYAFTVPSDLTRAPFVHMFRFAAFVIGLCLLLSVYPFRRQGQVNGFWQFNKVLVFRIILTGAFAVVLFAGLGLALAALDNLFGMHIPGKTYLDLWILINAIFSVGFFLAGIPENLDQLDADQEYPKAMKVFGQYVLSPLVLVYFVILYAYIAKIIATWNWPQGWVGRLILGFSATGILALFVLDPIRERLENRWIKRASRWYYLILLPLVVVLFLALSRRVSDYGITEDRYLGYAIGVWLAFIALYFIFSRIRSIKMIPASLCVLTFLISFGPWGMFAVAEKSQVGRLHDLLVSDSILVNGVVQKAPHEIPEKRSSQISSIMAYLHEVHGYDAIQPWFKEKLQEDSAGSRVGYKDAAYVMDLMGLEFHPAWHEGPANSYIFNIAPQIPVEISGYSHMVRIWYPEPGTEPKIKKDKSGCTIRAFADSLVLTITHDDKTADSLTLNLGPLADSMIACCRDIQGRNIPSDKAMMELGSERLRAKIVLTHIYLQMEKGKITPVNYDATILYSSGQDKK